MVEVFKTNILCKAAASELTNALVAMFPGYEVSFDLEDCDHILRVEAENIQPESIMQFMLEKGHHCEILM